jgi:hypothetical protein
VGGIVTGLGVGAAVGTDVGTGVGCAAVADGVAFAAGWVEAAASTPKAQVACEGQSVSKLPSCGRWILVYPEDNV